MALASYEDSEGTEKDASSLACERDGLEKSVPPHREQERRALPAPQSDEETLSFCDDDNNNVRS